MSYPGMEEFLTKEDLTHNIPANTWTGKCETCNGEIMQNLYPPYQWVCKKEAHEAYKKLTGRATDRALERYRKNPELYR